MGVCFLSIDNDSKKEGNIGPKYTTKNVIELNLLACHFATTYLLTQHSRNKI